MNHAELALEIQRTREALANHPDAPASSPAPAPRWTVTLRKYRTTWHYFTTNPQGGGFGSNYSGPKRIALDKALANIPAGDLVTVITSHQEEEISRETFTRPDSTRLETIFASYSARR